MEKTTYWVINTSSADPSRLRGVLRDAMYRWAKSGELLFRTGLPEAETSQEQDSHRFLVFKEAVDVQCLRSWCSRNHIKGGNVAYVVTEALKEIQLLELFSAGIHNVIRLENGDYSACFELLISPWTRYDACRYWGMDGLIAKPDQSKVAMISQWISVQPEMALEDLEYLIKDLESEDQFNLKELWQRNRSSGQAEHNSRLQTGKYISAGRAVIAGFGHSESLCEMAVVAAEHMEGRVVVIDADRLNPTADLHFGVKKFMSTISINNELASNSCLNVALDALQKNVMTREVLLESCMRVRKPGNLYVMTGNYNIGNYEYYEDQGLIRLIQLSREVFDLVFVINNPFIYDLYSSLSLGFSDINIFPVSPSLVEIRGVKKRLEFLKQKIQLDPDKNCYLAFEHSIRSDLDREALMEATDGKLVGVIEHSFARKKLRNHKEPFFLKMPKGIKKSYAGALVEMGILSQPTWKDRWRK